MGGVLQKPEDAAIGEHKPPNFCNICQKVYYKKVTGEFVKELVAVLGEKHVSSKFDLSPNSQKQLERCSVDKNEVQEPHKPEVVVKPADTQQVATVVRLCNKYKIPFLARGAGTGVEGGAIPVRGGVVIVMDRLNSVQILPEERLATVGAGLKKLELAQALKAHGLLFGPDPSSNPSIGGMASTGGSGMSTLMYGTTKENIKSLTVVTATGEVIERTRRHRVRKSSTGYELTQLYMGSEGTLGIITALTLKLHPIPPLRVGALCLFKTTNDAVNTVISLKNTQLSSLLRCELLNAECVRATNFFSKTAMEEKPTLLLEFAGFNAEVLRQHLQKACEIAQTHACDKVMQAEKGEELDALWAARRDCYYAAQQYWQHLQTTSPSSAQNGQKKQKRIFCTDICVPTPHLAEIVLLCEKLAKEANLICCICAHIADGNFHALIPYDGHDLNETEKVKRLESTLIDRALEMEGTVSGEHGVGLGKMDKILMEHGQVHLNVQKAIKQALDPHLLLNPGKVIYGKPPMSKL